MEFNETLQKELLSMNEKEQGVLQELLDCGETGSLEFHPRMKRLHMEQSHRMKEIIKQYKGWPGFSLVGKEGSEAAWTIVQNAALDKKFMKECLSLLQESIAKGDAEKWCLPYLQDKILTMSSKARIFNEQFDIDEHGDAHPKPEKNQKSAKEIREGFGLPPLQKASQ